MATATGLSRVLSSDATEVARVTPKSQRGGSLATNGTGQWDKQAVRMRNALGSMLEEAEREVGRSYEATVWRNLEDGTTRAYTGALYKFLQFSRINGFLSSREALRGGLLQVARDGQYETPVKVLLSG